MNPNSLINTQKLANDIIGNVKVVETKGHAIFRLSRGNKGGWRKRVRIKFKKSEKYLEFWILINVGISRTSNKSNLMISIYR